MSINNLFLRTRGGEIINYSSLNLQTALNGDLIPSTNNFYNLGNTSNKWKDLHVSDSINGKSAKIGNDLNSASIILSGASSSPLLSSKPVLYHKASVGLGLSSDYAMSFEINGSVSLTEAMRITNAGNIGIGTTTPTNILQVGGGGRLRIANINPANPIANDYTIIGTDDVDGNDNTRIAISGKYRTGFEGYIDYVGTSTGHHRWITGSSSERMRLTNLGNLGIGVSSPTGQLQLSLSTAIKSSGTTWSNPSDQRIKENIEDADLERCYNDIKNLKLRRFKYKDDFINNHQLEDKNVLGFIAQEVKNIFPKSVDIKPNELYNIDDFHNLNIDQMINALFGAFQKSQQYIEELKVENDLIKQRLNNLEQKIISNI